MGPFSGPNDPNLPDHIKGKAEYQKAKWVRHFNAAYDKAMREEKSAAEASSTALLVADALQDDDMYYYSDGQKVASTEPITPPKAVTASDFDDDALIALLQATDPETFAEEAGVLTQDFLKKLRELLSGEVDKDTLSAAIKKARSHAGGKGKARKRAAAEIDRFTVSDGPWSLVVARRMGEEVETVEDDTLRDAARREMFAATLPREDGAFEGVGAHHAFSEATPMTLHRSGLRSAAAELVASEIPAEAKVEGAKHLLAHFREIGEEGPDALSALVPVVASEDGKLVSIFSRWDTSLNNKFSFAEIAETDPLPEWIPMLPTPHTYKHPVWGDIVVTADGNAEFVRNFQAGIYQDKLPLDAEHMTKLSGACAWIVELRLNEDASADARVEWTKRGEKLVRDGGFEYISPEWYPQWTDPATEETFNHVLIGGALTTLPFFKPKSLAKLVASERLLASETGERLQIEGEALPMEVTEKQFSELMTQVGALNTRVETAEKEAQTLAATFSERVTTAVNAAVEEERGKLTQEFSEKMTALESQKEQAEKDAEAARKASEMAVGHIAALKQDAQIKSFTEEVTGRSASNNLAWDGPVEENVEMLKDFAEKFGEDSDQFKRFVTRMRAAAAKSSESYSEVGTARVTIPESSTLSAIDKAVQTYREQHPNTSYEAAYIKVIDEKPELYREYSGQHASSRQSPE